ncbi:hypothetical protein ACFYTC_42150 [Actinomadura nitritigenes]|uniref:hypothetical protein n=1 Tax=Actinomadura nitritigenes TaxID=134602 RepID=UPI0036CDF6E4
MKSAVIDEFHEFDSSVVIKSTEYFNHSYSPDLVASWPHDPTVPARYIYLRATSEPRYLLEDIDLISDHHPIVFALDMPEEALVDHSTEIRQRSERSDTLIANPSGVEQFIGERSSRFLNLVSTAVTQGGRGLIDESTGTDYADTLTAGFDAALRVEPKRTGRAAHVLESILTQRHADRVTRLLQAAWVGAGGQLEDFPGSRELVGDIADEALQFLLEYSPITSLEFWRRLGNRVTLKQLCRLTLPEGSENLNLFMFANRNFLKARCCRVTVERDRLGEEEQRHLRWLLERNLLVLRGQDFTAHVAESVEDIARVRPDASDGLFVERFLHRAGGVFIDEVDLDAAGGGVRYTPPSAALIEEDETFGRLASTLGASAIVKKAGIFAPPGQHVTCDFTSKTATGRTSAKLNLSQLVFVALRMFHSMTEQDRAELEEMLAYEDPSGQLPLL